MLTSPPPRRFDRGAEIGWLRGSMPIVAAAMVGGLVAVVSCAVLGGVAWDAALASFGAAAAIVGAVALAANRVLRGVRRSGEARDLARGQLIEAIESLGEGFALFDAKERLVLVNGAMQRMHPGLENLLRSGMSAQAVVQVYARSAQTEILDADDPDWLAGQMRRFRDPRGTDRVVLTRDGRWLRYVVRPTPSGGRVVLHADVTDVHERENRLRRVTNALERTGGDLDAALSNIAQGVCLFDAEARLILANRRVIEMYSLPPERIVPGVTLREIMDLAVGAGSYEPARGGPAAADRLAMVDRPERRSFLQTLTNGRVIEVVHQPLTGGGFVVTYADMTERQQVITELRNAKEAAEQASRAKSQFLATMSHELRTPLNAIIGFSEMIAGETYGPVGSPRYIEYSRDIRRSGIHLLDLINGILDTAKIEAGRYVLQEETVAVSAIVEVCLAMIRPHAEDARVGLTVAVAPALPNLRIDRRAAVQVLLNLLSNAVKFTPANGRVQIDANLRPDGDVVLQVRDTGVGIAPDIQARLFEPFVQGDPMVSRRHPGTGLGLSISRSLMELHGGSLVLNSRPGEGTTAEARFPAMRVIDDSSNPMAATVKT